MEQRLNDQPSPHRTFSRAEWAALRADTPMTLTPDEIVRLRSLNDRLDISDSDAIATAKGIWTRINLVNLRENILPTRPRADLILKKHANHLVSEVALRRL